MFADVKTTDDVPGLRLRIDALVASINAIHQLGSAQLPQANLELLRMRSRAFRFVFLVLGFYAFNERRSAAIPLCGQPGKPPCPKQCSDGSEPPCPKGPGGSGGGAKVGIPGVCTLNSGHGEYALEIAVGGLNHRGGDGRGNIEPPGVSELYQALRGTMHNPARMVVGFSGCIPQGFPRWDACTRIADWLGWPYQEISTTPVGLGAIWSPIEFLTMAGSSWTIKSSQFVRFPVAEEQIDGEDGFMYSLIFGTALDGTPVTLPLFVIRNMTGGTPITSEQMRWIVGQEAASLYTPDLLPPVIIGDFNDTNVTPDGGPSATWQAIAASAFAWLTANVSCSEWTHLSQPMLYKPSGFMNILYARPEGPFRCATHALVPRLIEYGSLPDGKPTNPSGDAIMVPDSGHGLASAKFDIVPHMPAPGCGGGARINCTAGTRPQTVCWKSGDPQSPPKPPCRVECIKN